MKTFRSHFIMSVIVFLYLLISPNLSLSQILGPTLDKGQFELGYTIKFFHRDLADNYILDWWSTAIFGRYAINKWLTISGEGIIGLEYPSQSSYSDYRGVGTGAGLVVDIIQIKHFQVSLSSHYFEILWFDRQQTYPHQNTRSLIAAFQIQRKFVYLGQEINIWLAPSYIEDTDLTYYPFPPGYPGIENSAQNKFGVVAGGDFVLFEHIHQFLHLVYADYIQPRFGVGFQF